MNTLQATIERAAELAYRENANQIVGRIDGVWEIAHTEDVGRQALMQRPLFTIGSEGLDDKDLEEAREYGWQ